MAKSFLAFVGKATSFFKRKFLQERLVNAASLIVGLSGVLAIGPHLQLYVVALLTSEEASIYSTAYQSSVSVLPQPWEWFSMLLWPQFLLMSFVIVILTIKIGRARKKFLVGSFIVFLVLTCGDLIYFAAISSAELGHIVESVVANLFGGPLVAALLVGGIGTADRLSRHLAEYGSYKKIFVFTFFPAAGAFLLMASYYLVALFYNPTESKVVGSLQPPIGGYYSAVDLSSDRGRSKEKSSHTDDSPAFSIFRADALIHESLRWQGGAKDLSINWERKSESLYDLFVGVFDGCNSADVFATGKTTLEFNDVRQIGISLDDGMANMVIGPESGGQFRVAEEKVMQYWISPTEKDNVKVVGFYDSARISYSNETGDARFSLTAMMMADSKKGGRQAVRRKITLLVDGERYVFNFSPDMKTRWDEKVSCENHPITTGTGNKYFSTGLSAGVIVQLRPKDMTLASSVDRKDLDRFSINGLNGWVSAEGIEKERVRYLMQAGRAGLFSFEANVKDLEINGEKVDVEPTDQIVVTDGDLNIGMNEDGGLNIEGKARAIYKNGDRLSKTRWERLDWTARAVIFGGIPGLFLWLWTLFSRLIKEDREIGVEFFPTPNVSA